MRLTAIVMLAFASQVVVSCNRPGRSDVTDPTYAPDREIVTALAKSPELRAYRDGAIRECRKAVKADTPHANSLSTENFCGCTTDAGMKGKTLADLTSPGFQQDAPEECMKRYGPRVD
jgi:hypothetical protein